MVWDDLKKIVKGARLELNKMKGSAAEEISMLRSEARGNEVQRTGRGSNYRERKIDILTGKKGSWIDVKVKSGQAKLSKLQKKTKRKKSRYRIDRY
ncbi:MAG: hypothetical protein N3G80_03720 [Candidatus Micrarchaeota archaeon]|nr:hypothetical protein [Candidatus Micrarchaeota archaeon]